MRQLPNWRSSPRLADLLLRFLEPADADLRIKWLTSADIGVNPRRWIDSLIADGTLVPATPAEQLALSSRASALKAVLAQRGDRTSGTKAELAAAIVRIDPALAASLVGSKRIVRCSDAAAAELQRREAERERLLHVAKNESCQALLLGDSSRACSIAATFLETWGHRSETAGVFIGDVEAALRATHSKLRSLSGLELAQFRAAACMTMLWLKESIVEWLPEDFPVLESDYETVRNHFMRKLAISSQLRFAEGCALVTFRLRPGASDGCGLCREIADRPIRPEDLPEIPLPNCTSRQGCNGYIDWDEQDDAVSVSLGGATAAERLAELKELLAGELITREEYDAKRRQIIDDI